MFECVSQLRWKSGFAARICELSSSRVAILSTTHQVCNSYELLDTRGKRPCGAPAEYLAGLNFDVFCSVLMSFFSIFFVVVRVMGVVSHGFAKDLGSRARCGGDCGGSGSGVEGQ